MVKQWHFATELEINPVPHRNVTVTRWGTAYKGKRETAYINDLSKKIKDSLDDDFERFGEVPLQVSYTFGYMPAKSWSKKKKQEAFDNKWMIAKPDIDNVLKSTSDILMQDIITDDQWFVNYKDIKMIYTKTPLIQIDIKEIWLGVQLMV